MSLNYVTLTVDVFDAQGNPPTSGTATFTPSATLTDTTNHELIAQIPITVAFKAGQTPTVKLLATDNGTLAPSGWGWGVTFSGAGMPSSFSFFLPHSGGGAQNLADLSPTSSVVTMAGYLPLDYPSGASTGYVWTSTDNAGTGAWVAAPGGAPSGSAGGDLGSTYPNPTVTATHLASALPIAQGGTGQGTAQAAMDALAGAQTSGDYLRGTGSHVQMSAIQAADLPTATGSAQGAVIAADTAQTTPTFPDASALYSGAARMPGTVQPTVVVTDFQSGHGWTHSGSGSAALNDTTAGNFIIGTQAVTLTSAGTVSTQSDVRNFSISSFNATSSNVRLRFRVPVLTHLTEFDFYIGSGSGMSSFYKWSIYVSGVSPYITAGDWITITLLFSDAAVTGSPVLSALTCAQFQIWDDGNAVTMQCQSVEIVPDGTSRFPKGVVSICFDDTYSTPMTTGAWATLDAAGFPATLMTITNLVGNNGRLALSDIQTRVDRFGWESAGHADTDTDHAATDTGLTAAALDTDMRAQRAWLLANGIRGGDGYAYPLGQVGLTTDSQPVIGIVRRYYSWARTTSSRMHETWPPADRYRLRATSTITTFSGGITPSSVESLISTIAATGGWVILVFHSIVTGSPGVTTECQLSDFQAIVAAIQSAGTPVMTIGDVISHYDLEYGAPLPISGGGTGQATAQLAMDALAGAVTSGDYLRGSGSHVVMSAIQGADVPTLNQNTSGTAAGLSTTLAIASGGTGQTAAAAAYNALSPMTTTGDIEYESGASTAARLGGNTTSTKEFLTSTGSGGNATAPAWGTIAAGDLPAATTSAQGAVELDGTAGDIKALAASAAAGSSAKAAAADHVHPNTALLTVNSLSPGDHGLIAWNFPPYNCRTSDVLAMSTGVLALSMIRIPYACTITNIVFNVNQAGTSLTSGDNFGGLFNGTATGALLSATGDQTTNFGTTANYTAALSMAQSVTAGLYYVGWFFKGTGTAVSLSNGHTGAMSNIGIAGTPFVSATANSGLTTAMPMNITTQSALSGVYWCGVS